jgi:hypothetical protein
MLLYSMRDADADASARLDTDELAMKRRQADDSIINSVA